MTVIAWDGKVLAADSRCLNGNSTLVSDNVQKIHLIKNPYFGKSVTVAAAFCGSLNLIGPWLDAIPKIGFGPLPLETIDDDNGAYGLTIAPDGTCFNHDIYGQYYETKGQYMAMGSGADIARHYLAKGASAIDAVRESYLTEVTCGGPIRYYDLATGKMGEITP